MINAKPVWIYTVDVFDGITQQWIAERRRYYQEKQLDAFDLSDIPGKRKNAQLLEQSIELSEPSSTDSVIE